MHFMNQQTDKAILVVSFGTSYEASRKATIEKIEQDIADAFGDHRIYRAWTSKMIISVLKKRDNYIVPTVKEAMEQMIADGIREVAVQPTHILDGIENHVMKEEVLSYKESFDKIVFGTPLLTSPEDEQKAIEAVNSEFSDLKDPEALVLMAMEPRIRLMLFMQDWIRSLKLQDTPTSLSEQWKQNQRSRILSERYLLSSHPRSI